MIAARVCWLACLLVVVSLVLVDPAPAMAATRPVRLEAGTQTGYRFSSSGVILARRSITVTTTPKLTATDRRRIVPNHSGIWLRITAGSLRGYEVRESPVAYIPGIAGSAAYVPEATIRLRSGAYLGYRFDRSWGLASTRYATIATTANARASRRAVIDGRPYVYLTTSRWSNTWMPVTASRGRTAQPLTCSVPGRAPDGARVVLRRVATTEKKLALTFDLGGRLTPALDILERLVIDRVCATIHPTGQAATTATGQAVLAMIKAHPELFETGNHTMWHCDLVRGGTGTHCPTTPPADDRIRAELRNAEAIIVAGTGHSPRPYWRPPYGSSSAHVRSVAASAGYPTTVLWDIDTVDWKPIGDGGPTTAAISAKVVTNARPGSIVLMHLGGYHTFDALPSMVLRLRAAGLQPTSISDLLDLSAASWTRVGEVPGAAVDAAVGFDRGYVALGSEMAFPSANGASWSSVPLVEWLSACVDGRPSDLRMADAFASAIATDGSRLVIVGVQAQRTPAGCIDRSTPSAPVSWASSDGRTWRRSPPFAPSGVDVDALVVWPTPDGWRVAVAAGDDASSLIYGSADGLTWTRIGAALEGRVLRAAADAAGTVVLARETPDGVVHIERTLPSGGRATLAGAAACAAADMLIVPPQPKRVDRWLLDSVASRCSSRDLESWLHTRTDYWTTNLAQTRYGAIVTGDTGFCIDCDPHPIAEISFDGLTWRTIPAPPIHYASTLADGPGGVILLGPSDGEATVVWRLTP